MKQSISSIACWLLFSLFCSLGTTATVVASTPPDIILIMADDLGIEGLGCYGGVSYATANLDRLASQGVRFTHAYSQPLCTPTRVQLMTGKYNHRNWRAFGILAPDQRTFGHAMSEAGYATAIFGKWQLYSYDPPDFPGAAKRRGKGLHPKDAGFDQYALFHALHTEDKGSRYANPTMLEGTRESKGQLKTYPGRYGPDVWVEKILHYLDQPQQRPRFIYYPMALPHWPFQPTPDSDNWDPRRTQETHLRYAADMIEYTDTVVGNLMHGLEARNLARDTVVIFYSDNGTHLDVSSTMRGGRVIQGGKAMTTQTAIHVPLIVHCPNRFSPAAVSEIVDASDFFPTLLDLAGVDLEAKTKPIDGVSFLPLLLGQPGPSREAAFFWYDPRPGWDKERFSRHVFALNKTHKLFRDGRLYRLSNVPLEENFVDKANWTKTDRKAAEALQAVLENSMAGVQEPPLVDAYGRPIH